MPESYAEQYFPVLVQALLAMAVAAGLITVSYLLGKRVRNRVKDMPYESGMVPTGDARHRFSVKFYLVAMLFILFDIEAIFLYPWVVVYPRAEDVRVRRDAGVCGADSFRVFLHLEKGSAGLVRSPTGRTVNDNVCNAARSICANRPVAAGAWRHSTPTR